MNAPRKYRVLGTTEDAPTGGCQCCGRANLKVYVALEPLEGGPIVYMGTTCGAKAERITVREINSEVRAAAMERMRLERVERQERAAVEEAEFRVWVSKVYGVTFSQPADLWGKVEGETPFTLRKLWRESVLSR